jgi:ubiquinone/menaquinone biosynthesis C-methylase UbiE
MKKLPLNETRTEKEIKEHYHLECRLAHRLRNSTREERQYLYESLYKELFEKIPYFHKKKMDKEKRLQIVSRQITALKNYLKPEDIFLEIGAGDCALSLQLCNIQKSVFAVDVTKQIPLNTNLPKNFNFVLSNGTFINVPSESIDIAFSNHVVEHIHPDDVIEQLKSIYNVLKPKGIYIIYTPHRYTGPHDISKYFDETATGFHLKEYTNIELYHMLRAVGFSKINYMTQNEKYRNLPIWPSILLESAMAPLPQVYKKTVSNKPFLKKLIDIRIAATK